MKITNRIEGINSRKSNTRGKLNENLNIIKPIA